MQSLGSLTPTPEELTGLVPCFWSSSNHLFEVNREPGKGVRVLGDTHIRN